MKHLLILALLPVTALAQPILHETEIAEKMKSRSEEHSGQRLIIEANIKSVAKPFSGATHMDDYEITTVRGLKFIVNLGHFAKSHEKITVRQNQAYAISANRNMKQQPRAIFDPGKPLFFQLTYNPRGATDVRILDAGEVSRARAQNAAKAKGAGSESGGGISLDKEQILNRLQYLRAKLDAGGTTATVTGITGYAGTVQVQMSDAERQSIENEINILEALLVR